MRPIKLKAIRHVQIPVVQRGPVGDDVLDQRAVFLVEIDPAGPIRLDRFFCARFGARAGFEDDFAGYDAVFIREDLSIISYRVSYSRRIWGKRTSQDWMTGTNSCA